MKLTIAVVALLASWKEVAAFAPPRKSCVEFGRKPLVVLRANGDIVAGFHGQDESEFDYGYGNKAPIRPETSRPPTGALHNPAPSATEIIGDILERDQNADVNRDAYRPKDTAFRNGHGALSEKEAAAVDRLARMGFHPADAAQAFMASNKDEARAADMLMESGGRVGAKDGFDYASNGRDYGMKPYGGPMQERPDRAAHPYERRSGEDERFRDDEEEFSIPEFNSYEELERALDENDVDDVIRDPLVAKKALELIARKKAAAARRDGRPERTLQGSFPPDDLDRSPHPLSNRRRSENPLKAEFPPRDDFDHDDPRPLPRRSGRPPDRGSFPPPDDFRGVDGPPPGPMRDGPPRRPPVRGSFPPDDIAEMDDRIPFPDPQRRPPPERPPTRGQFPPRDDFEMDGPPEMARRPTEKGRQDQRRKKGSGIQGAIVKKESTKNVSQKKRKLEKILATQDFTETVKEDRKVGEYDEVRNWLTGKLPLLASHHLKEYSRRLVEYGFDSAAMLDQELWAQNEEAKVLEKIEMKEAHRSALLRAIMYDS